jgi:dTDP-4-dehydrorhamnose 3,5-epimerase/CDP-3, 6-dideoxy-D-glycero-D-glycero-4-hexulose-5-epimerase
MSITNKLLDGVALCELDRFTDLRGSFVKTFMLNSSAYYDISKFKLYEEFYSLSNSGVIRGMHFQRPPFVQAKLIYCVYGLVKDVLLDLRSGDDYGKINEIILNYKNPKVLFIPPGVAHGFISLTDNSCLIYKCDKPYSAKYEDGIRWNSFGYDWDNKNPILSTRDKKLNDFNYFKSPF